MEALLYLSRCNRYSNTPQAVTSFLNSTKGTVSQTLKVLEKRGLLIKRPDPDDRRVIHLHLTPDGETMTRDLAVPSVLEEALAEISREKTLANELEKLLVAMQRIGGHLTFGTCHTCRLFRREDGGFRCGLTNEELRVTDSELICRDHERKP